MIETTVSEQTLSPSSSEIMKKATRLVDQLLLKTSNDFPNQKATLVKQNNVLGPRISVAEENINCESNSITDSETFSALNSARKSIPSIDIIKRLAGRLKNKNSETISELNFPNKRISSGQDIDDHYLQKSDNYRSKSASPTSSENREENSVGLSHDFAQMNAKLSEINKRVESLSSNIEDIQDTDQFEGVGCCAKIENKRDFSMFDIKGNANHRAYENDVDDNYLNQLNVAVLQQERLRMWARDNAKYASSISNTSENGNNRESEHIPFSDVYYTHQSIKYKNGELTSSVGILNSSVLSTTVSGTTGQFAHSNDTTIYESKSNGKNCISDLYGTVKVCTGGENSENKDSEIGVTSATGSFGRIPGNSIEPKALRFIRVGNQLRRSITVTPLVENIQRILTGEAVNPNIIFEDSDFESRVQFNSKLEKLSNSNISPFNSSRSSGYFSNNMVIITVKDNGSRLKRSTRQGTINDKASVDSAESDRNYFFSCRECSWNPANACSVQ